MWLPNPCYLDIAQENLKKPEEAKKNGNLPEPSWNCEWNRNRNWGYLTLYHVRDKQQHKDPICLDQ